MTVWVNGVQGAKTTGVSIFSKGEKMQWRNWSVYAARAVYSGVQSKTTFEDIDNLQRRSQPELIHLSQRHGRTNVSSRREITPTQM